MNSRQASEGDDEATEDLTDTFKWPTPVGDRDTLHLLLRTTSLFTLDDASGAHARSDAHRHDADLGVRPLQLRQKGGNLT